MNQETGSGATLPRTLEIEGMHCASCVARVEKALTGVPGVESASVNLATERAEVVAGRGVTSAALEAAVREAGYAAWATRGEPGATATTAQTAEVAASAAGDAPAADRLARRRAARRLRRAQLATGAVLSGAILVLAYGVPAARWSNPVQLVLALPILLWVGASFHRGALRALRHGGTTMDTLVSVGATVAFAYSVAATLAPALRGRPTYFDVASLIITLISVGKYLEMVARGKAGEAIEQLAGLQPRLAHRLVAWDATEVEDVGTESVRVGDLLLVRPGEPIPTDGSVVAGHGAVDEQLLTGESLPVAKAEGSELIGGTVNGSSPLRMRVERTGAATVLAQIVRLVEHAQAEKPPVQRLADRVSAVFVPAILVLAALTFAGWAITGHGLVAAMIPAVATVVVACPCALGLATPVAVMVSSGRGAELGLLIRGGETLETVHRLGAVVLDKTGTLTEGSPALLLVVALEDTDADAALALGAAVEVSSEHPLARAVVAGAEERLGHPAPVGVTNVLSSPGGGIAGTVGGRRVQVGALRWLGGEGVPVASGAAPEADLAGRGQSVVGVAVDARLRLLLGIADPLRPESAAGVRRLRAMGLRVILATGDGAETAAAIARATGIDEWRAELRPEAKVALIDELRAGGVTVAMVGDGVNDAPALAAADVGIALGSGTGAAMAAASITLVHGDVGRVGDAISLSRATLRVIRQNLAWAFGYNLVLVPLAMLDVIPPELAALAMACSSVTVVGNALRLRRWRPATAPEMDGEQLSPPRIRVA
ncbi:MAG: heavy metal translocating P-type ATPase [Candidatus Dormibacteria bacterium]